MSIWIMREGAEIRGVFTDWDKCVKHAQETYNPHRVHTVNLNAPAFPYPDCGDIDIKDRLGEHMHTFTCGKYEVK